MATSVLAFLLLLFIEPILAKQQVDEEFLRNNRTIERFVNIRTHSLHAPYIDQDLQNRWWDFGADAYVNTNKHIRLTRAVSSQMGWLWSRLPLTAIHYEIDVEFKVSGDSSHLYGDGFAMWLTRKRAEPGPLFGAPDYFEGLGIIVDTYANSRHSYGFPRIMAVLGDGKTHFDKDNDFDGQTLDACSANIRRASVATKLKVTYVKDELLEVKVQYKGWDEWTPCIKVRDVSLPTSPFLGFTALTGEVYDAHDIVSVSSNSAYLSLPGRSRTELQGAYSPKGSSWFWTLLKWTTFLAIAFVAFTAYTTWAKRNGRVHGGFGNIVNRYDPNKRF